MRLFASLWLCSLLLLGTAWAQQQHAARDPEDTVRHVYKWLCKPAQDKKLQGLYWAVTEEPAVRNHELDFTPEFFKAMRAGFKSGNCDFDFLTCLLSQLPVEPPAVGVAKVSGEAAVVPVTLTLSTRGTPDSGSRTQHLLVDLRRTGGVWKVSNVRNNEGMDVMREIKKQL